MICALAVLKLLATSVVTFPFIVLPVVTFTVAALTVYASTVAALAVVKLPVLAVVTPIAVPLTLPPVITALAELKFVTTRVPAEPPVMLAAVVFKVAVVVVAAPNVVMLPVLAFRVAIVAVVPFMEPNTVSALPMSTAPPIYAPPVET